VDLFQCSRVASYEVLGEGRMAQGREIEEGSSVALHGDSSSRGACRRGYLPALAAPQLCSLALQSRTAALRCAVARLFWLRATACIGSTEGEVTASVREATAGFCGQMHGRLGARLVGSGVRAATAWIPARGLQPRLRCGHERSAAQVIVGACEGDRCVREGVYGGREAVEAEAVEARERIPRHR
jgi:hypothetical protein